LLADFLFHIDQLAFFWALWPHGFGCVGDSLVALEVFNFVGACFMIWQVDSFCSVEFKDHSVWLIVFPSLRQWFARLRMKVTPDYLRQFWFGCDSKHLSSWFDCLFFCLRESVHFSVSFFCFMPHYVFHVQSIPCWCVSH
jgi:hypothetical protein